MIGGRIRAAAGSRRVAWTALALALLVPARVAALCCRQASAERAPTVFAHQHAHHPTQATPPNRAAVSPDTGDPDCGSLEEVAPALRERGPADGGTCLLPIARAPNLPAAGPRSMHAPARMTVADFSAPPIAPLRI
ncbi:MAG TPA: hypothetical protein VFS53_00175 [Gemmatimonadota bacterium]|nr:hypothetical protein [Gemmatimonadota bacterium]